MENIKCNDKYQAVTEDKNISDIITNNINITKSYGVTIDGTYNALVDINGYIRARGRSEMLILKGDKVYLSKSKHGLSEKYGIPGGGWDPNEDHAVTAARESEEESRLKTKNVEYASSYLLIYDDIPGWVKKKIPEEYQWKAYYTEVYVGEYDGKYTGKIDDEDKDDIIKTGKFYDIKDVFDDLHPIHQAAIMNYLSSAKNESNIVSQENSVFSEAQDCTAENTVTINEDGALALIALVVFGTIAAQGAMDQIKGSSQSDTYDWAVSDNNDYESKFPTAKIALVDYAAKHGVKEGAKNVLYTSNSSLLNKKIKILRVYKSPLYRNKSIIFKEGTFEKLCEDYGIGVDNKASVSNKYVNGNVAINGVYIQSLAGFCMDGKMSESDAKKYNGYLKDIEKGLDNFGDIEFIESYYKASTADISKLLDSTKYRDAADAYGIDNFSKDENVVEIIRNSGGDGIIYRCKDKQLYEYDHETGKATKTSLNISKILTTAKSCYKDAISLLKSTKNESTILESSKYPDEVPDDIIDLLKRLNSYDYGYIKDGKKVKGMKNFFDDYRSLTISEFERYKIGVCWDYVHYEANWFKKHGYKCDTFYVQIQDEAGDCPSHTYLVFYLPDSDKVYYFESSWGKYSGIEAFDNVSKLHSTIKDRHIQYYNTKSKCDPSSYFIEKFNAESTSWEHLKCGEYMVKVSKGRIKLESTILEEKRSEIPTKEFGVPSKRKFPLTDADHVKSAIKFFNYVDEEDEAELARNIKRKAKEFGVIIRCGKQNRLSKYISKEYVNEFMAVSAIGNCMYAVNNGNIKQHISQGDHIVSATDSYPFTKKEKKKKKDPVDGRISMYMGDGEKLAVNESSSSKVPIYIIAFDYSSIFANTLKMATHSHFNHISIALSPDLNKAYTFARSIKGDNSKKGFTIEPLSSMIKEHGDFLIKVNAVYVNKNQYKEIKECIEYYVKHKDDTSYNYSNLIKAAFKVGIDNDDLDDDSMNCSIFVDYILKKSGVDITGNPNSNLVFPEHLANADNNHDNVITVYYGKASGYDKKKIERINLESSVIEEAKTIKACKKCGSPNIGVIIRGEPVYICKDCGAYNGVVPFKEGASDDTFFDDITKQFDDLDMEPIPTDIFHERKDQP